MFSYFDALRKKPLAERREIARNTAIGVVIVIAGLWLLSNFSSFTTPKNTEREYQWQGVSSKIQGPYE